MTREEVIMKEVEECFEYFDKDGYDEEFLSTTSAENITDLIIKHEQDTLRELVKCISYSLINDDRVEYDEYLKIMAVIRQDLENFLKERKNAQ